MNVKTGCSRIIEEGRNGVKGGDWGRGGSECLTALIR